MKKRQEAHGGSTPSRLDVSALVCFWGLVLLQRLLTAAQGGESVSCSSLPSPKQPVPSEAAPRPPAPWDQQPSMAVGH